MDIKKGKKSQYFGEITIRASPPMMIPEVARARARPLLKTDGQAWLARSLQISLKVGTERQQTRQASSRETSWGSRPISRSAAITARVQRGSVVEGGLSGHCLI